MQPESPRNLGKTRLLEAQGERVEAGGGVEVPPFRAFFGGIGLFSRFPEPRRRLTPEGKKAETVRSRWTAQRCKVVTGAFSGAGAV